MEELKYLLVTYAFVVTVNAAVSFFLWRSTRSPLYRLLLLIWGAFACSLVINGLASNQSPFVRLLMFTGTYGPIFLASWLTSIFRKIHFPVRLFFAVLTSGFVATVLLHFTCNNPAIVATPLLFGLGFPGYYVFFSAVLSKSKQPWSVSEKGLVLTNLVFAIHGQDYAFCYDPATLWVQQVGFLIALIILFALSIFAPAAVTETVTRENADIRHQNELERQARQKDLETQKAVQNILDNLGQGFMMFDSSGKVLPGVSRVAFELFNTDPQGKTLAQLLVVDAEKLEELEKWIPMLFDEPIEFASLKDLGPKVYRKNLEKYIELDYRPVRNSVGRIEKVILVATDRTTEELLKEKAEAEATLTRMVISILKNKQAFADFIHSTRKMLAELSQEFAKGDTELNVTFVLRYLHSIKGCAGLYNIVDLQKATHSLEDRIIVAQRGGKVAFREMLPEIRGDVLSLGKCLEDFLVRHRYIVGHISDSVGRERIVSLSHLEEIGAGLAQELRPNSPMLKAYLERLLAESVESWFTQFELTVSHIAKIQGKEVDFLIEPSGLRALYRPYADLLSAMVHVFRNAIDHGLEKIEERKRVGKEPIGKIRVSFARRDEADSVRMRIQVQDDGRGINPSDVGAIALDRGLVDQERLSTMSAEEIVQLVFAPGFSTKSDISEISGRGVGLDAVLCEVFRLQGKAWIETMMGRGTKVIIDVPLLNQL